MLRLAGLLAVASLAACGPPSPRLAADECEERAVKADGPWGQVRAGVSNDGVKGGLTVGITSDYLRGRDPHLVYETCVYEKTGQGPIRPLDLTPRPF